MPDSFDQTLAHQIDQYIEQLFSQPDAALVQGLQDAQADGLPSINVSANEGKLLYLIAQMCGAKRILEIGTLGGFSGTWFARALPADGKLITLEVDPKHAQIARKNFDRAGVGNKTEIRIGHALDTLKAMVEHGEGPFDLFFIDADKDAYVEYLNLCVQLSHPGSVILADNLIRNGRVLQANSTEVKVLGAQAYNNALAAHPHLDSLILPIIRDYLDGLSISIVKREA